ncbi:MAG: DUF2083 domain-containing protein [Deltaproteobacteria bacterium]|nr:DUF2083 domain-containing protein [Deltaproteobacteria bacterium]
MGPRLRALRLDRGQSQAELARRLGISAAYLNLIEKGRRPVQLPLLWKALELLQVEPEPFLGGLAEARSGRGLSELLEDPLLRSLDLDRGDLAVLASEPAAVTAVTALFRLYKDARTQLDRMQALWAQREDVPGEPAAGPASPLDEVVEFLGARRNHFPELEELAEAMRRRLGLERRVLSDALAAALSGHLGVEVAVLAPGAAPGVVRRYDPGQGRLFLSADLPEARRKFDLAHVIGLRTMADSGLDRAILEGERFRHPETAPLVRIHLANYFAGALLLPYADVFHEAQRHRYDVDALSGLYEMSYEAVAHRLTNLADPRRRGVPMHFLRVDIGGNISKRFSATGLSLPGGLGTCPKWAAHTAFLTPSSISRQYGSMPDGRAYFCFARVQASPVQGSLVKGTLYSIGLGTHAEDAQHLAYADDLPRYAPDRAARIAVPVGVTCRFCERTDCSQRAAPSYRFPLAVDENVKLENFFSARSEAETPAAMEAARPPPRIHRESGPSSPRASSRPLRTRR